MPSKATTSPIELPLDYYHQNFCQLLQVAEARYGDLLNDDERHFYQVFFKASKAAQCLYVRLSGRSKSIFRQSKLSYAEIPQLPEAALELQELGLLRVNPTLGIEQLLPLFTKPELVSLLNVAGASKLNRAALDQHLSDHVDEHMLQTLHAGDTLIEVLLEEYLPIFKLFFFGNLYQDLSEFVLRDLAIFQYESYSLDAQSRQFSSRAQLEQHLLYYACSQLSDDTVEQGPEAIVALSDALPKAEDNDHSLQRRVARLRNHLARELERQKETQLALELYRQSSCTPARERRARIKMNNGDIDSSLALCREILEQPVDEAEAVFAQQFGQRHAKRFDRPWKKIEAHKAPERQFTLTKSSNVERDTALHLSQHGECFFVENTLFSSVLGLVIWPAIFAPVRGAFSHPFQHRPHDFHHPDFSHYRQELIHTEINLQLSDQEAFNSQVIARYNDKYGLANPLVHWGAIDEELLLRGLQRIPTIHWQAVFKRLLSDLRNHRNGLPDLIFFPEEGGYELVEVKGPGDRLQDNQKRWMNFFHQHDIPHWVAQVTWCDDSAND